MPGALPELYLPGGTGGIGKTTSAAADAAGLAARAQGVLLAPSDPGGASDRDTGGRCAAPPSARSTPRPRRQSSRPRPATGAAGLAPQGRALPEEDLRSPRTEEIAVLQVFFPHGSRGMPQVHRDARRARPTRAVAARCRRPGVPRAAAPRRADGRAHHHAAIRPHDPGATSRRIAAQAEMACRGQAPGLGRHRKPRRRCDRASDPGRTCCDICARNREGEGQLAICHASVPLLAQDPIGADRLRT